MVIRIHKNFECVRVIDIDDELALQLFNKILLSLGDGESATLYSGEDEHIVAYGF